MAARERREETFGSKLLQHEPVELERHMLGRIDEAHVELARAERNELLGDRQLTQLEHVRRLGAAKLGDESRDQAVGE